MANELTPFNPAAGMPAHVANFFGDAGTNIQDRTTVPSLSPEGKMWTVSVNGQKTKIMKPDSDGEMVPVSIMRVVILDYAKRRGRAYYEGNYDPDKIGAPVCWSDDGITPDASVPQPQSVKCDTCPMAAKGSKITDGGKAVTACSQHRMLALVPSHKLDFTPLRLKIAITSDFDKQSPDAEAQGWYAFSQYTDFLKSRGVQHTAAIVTKMKFDPNAPYPKIFFAADRWLDPNELSIVAPLTKDEGVQKLLGGTWTPAGVDGTRKDDTTATAAPATKAQAATLTTAEDDDDGIVVMEPVHDAPAAEPVQEPAQAATPAPKAPKTTAAPKAAVSPPVEEASAVASTKKLDPALEALLKDWGGDQ